MERKINERGDINLFKGDTSSSQRSDSPTRRNMERLERLKSADLDLRSKYEQYKIKSEKHGESFFKLDNACNKINSEMFNMPSDKERGELIADYLSEHEKWNESEIDNKFNKLKESLSFVEREEIDEYVRYGKELRKLKEELDDIYEKIGEHNKSVNDHNAYSSNKLNTIENENWRNISDGIYIKRVQEAAEE